MENVGKKKLDMQKLLAPAALVILYIVFSVFGNNFLSLDMVKNILESSYYIGFMAFGVTFIIITGGIDLSLGTVMMCAALLGGYVFKQGWPLILAIALTLFVGIAFGFVNGVLVAKLKLPPFIATLGTQMMSMGFGSIITKVQSQTWPTATAEVGGWFKKVFIRAELFGIKRSSCIRRSSAATSTPSAPMKRRPACPASTSTTGRSRSIRSPASSWACAACSTPRPTPPSPRAPATARK